MSSSTRCVEAHDPAEHRHRRRRWSDPPLVGWAAARGSLGAGAGLLFAIVLVWTPPHFWGVALLLAPQYAAASVPMMPVIRGPQATAEHVLAYAVVLVAVTLLPGMIGTFGLLYLVAAGSLGAVFVALAWRLRRVQSAGGSALLFHPSLLYLALLFVAVAADAAIG
jgi:protoheme IX farnesyltransferase